MSPRRQAQPELDQGGDEVRHRRRLTGGARIALLAITWSTSTVSPTTVPGSWNDAVRSSETFSNAVRALSPS